MRVRVCVWGTKEQINGLRLLMESIDDGCGDEEWAEWLHEEAKRIFYQIKEE